MAEQLKAAGYRVKLDDEAGHMNPKIKDAELKKIPFVFIVGGQEIENNTVNVRRRKKGKLGAMSIAEFIEMTSEEIKQGVPLPLE